MKTLTRIAFKAKQQNILSLLSICTAIILLSACGAEEKDAQQPAQNYQGQPSSVHCSFSVDGKNYEGRSAEECEQLKADLGLETQAPISQPKSPNTDTSAVHCAFNINGELYEGRSKEECDKLREDLGLEEVVITPVDKPAEEPAEQPVEEAPAEQATPAPTNESYQCAFNINGVLYEGDSREKCDKLKKDLGINF